MSPEAQRPESEQETAQRLYKILNQDFPRPTHPDIYLARYMIPREKEANYPFGWTVDHLKIDPKSHNGHRIEISVWEKRVAAHIWPREVRYILDPNSPELFKRESPHEPQAWETVDGESVDLKSTIEYVVNVIRFS